MNLLNGFGPKIRQPHNKFRKLASKKYVCDNCKTQKLTRKFSGLWSCGKCGYLVTGEAFNP